MSGCPVVHNFDPLENAYLQDPYQTYTGLREQGPIVYSPELDHYLVTRHAEIEQIFRRPEDFSGANAVQPLWPVCPEAKEILAAGMHAGPAPSGLDGQRHARIRQIQAKALTRKHMLRIEPEIRRQTQTLVDGMFVDGVAELYSGLAFPLPAYIGLNLVGFPVEDAELLKRWAGSRMLLVGGRADPETQVRIANDLVAHWEYCEHFVRSRLENPTDDFISEILQEHIKDPEALTFNDVATTAYVLTTASHETTTYAIMNGVLALLRQRNEWERLCREPALIPRAVEELLRFDGSASHWRRIARRTVTVGDVVIPEGARVMMLLGSGNRDPETFAEPDQVDISRRNANQHFTFGKGIHFCLGAPLARMEMEIVLEILTAQAPDLRLVEGQGDLPYSPNIVLRGMNHLLVESESRRQAPVAAK